jgi:hypothetical protein
MRNPSTSSGTVLGAVGITLLAGLAVAGCQYGTGTGGTSAATSAPVGAVSTTAPGTSTGQWTMPNLVGANLQAAQDRIQSLTHNMIFFTSSHDVSGRGRHQVLDRDWQVCSQNVAAGTTITVGTKIDFGVVKSTESCP